MKKSARLAVSAALACAALPAAAAWVAEKDASNAADPDGLGSYCVYRGRCPCGCVATAAALGFRHFRWPARIDRVDSFSHDFTGTNGIATTFPIRFDGHLPIDWDSLDDEYEWYIGGYDLRGKVAEAVRHPIARLVMFADVLAEMSFTDDGSSANYRAVASGAAEWYTPGTWVAPNDARVLSDIASGVPVQVTVPGHAVVGHGWAAEGEESYIYLNYGWGGSNDGYYNIGSTIQEVCVGHYPRAKPQLDPLPKVCGTGLTLGWHFPDFHTNSLSGFTVSISKTATTPSTFLDDFSASAGVSSYENGIYVATDSVGYDGSLLFTKPIAAGTYTFPGSYTLTSASVLTFRLYSFAALGAVYKVEARLPAMPTQTATDSRTGPSTSAGRAQSTLRASLRRPSGWRTASRLSAMSRRTGLPPGSRPWSRERTTLPKTSLAGRLRQERPPCTISWWRSFPSEDGWVVR